jgi:hypothetical protein
LNPKKKSCTQKKRDQKKGADRTKKERTEKKAAAKKRPGPRTKKTPKKRNFSGFWGRAGAFKDF